MSATVTSYGIARAAVMRQSYAILLTILACEAACSIIGLNGAGDEHAWNNYLISFAASVGASAILVCSWISSHKHSGSPG
ncbi:hypothetical protein [Methylobacterium nodulans]|uniref:hypothetical protein n=1 Tax=Methylobacterium nodulans TaxID=114616 RepID=UPI0012EE9EA0|nr:hypothetical protein [Methylobacterium nodulans]